MELSKGLPIFPIDAEEKVPVLPSLPPVFTRNALIEIVYSMRPKDDPEQLSDVEKKYPGAGFCWIAAIANAASLLVDKEQQIDRQIKVAEAILNMITKPWIEYPTLVKAVIAGKIDPSEFIGSDGGLAHVFKRSQAGRHMLEQLGIQISQPGVVLTDDYPACLFKLDDNVPYLLSFRDVNSGDGHLVTAINVWFNGRRYMVVYDWLEHKPIFIPMMEIAKGPYFYNYYNVAGEEIYRFFIDPSELPYVVSQTTGVIETDKR